jgi:hypothetical protein
MLNALPRTSTHVFGNCTINSLKAAYGRARRRLAFKPQNPRLLEIHFQLDKSLFQNLPDDSFIIRAAHNLEEAVKLGEVGFEPFVVMEGVQFFRKRK